MPSKKKRVTLPDGKQADAALVGFREGSEHWNEYLLEDGTVLRVKLVLGEVMRVDGEFDGDGNPLYLTKMQNVMIINSPDELRKE